jgi:peptidyl-prolyl cis-trans isomerase SurA
MMSRNLFKAALAISTLLCALALPMVCVQAAGSNEVLVTINDRPLTAFDIDMRINLWKLLGRQAGANSRKVALDELIDDMAEIEEARKRNMLAKPAEIDQRLESVAKGLKTDNKGLKGKLKAQGITVSALRLYLEAQIAFSRLIRTEKKVDFTVSKAEVNRQVAAYKAEIDDKINAQIRKIESDPRRKAVTVYKIQEINFPIEKIDGGLTDEILQTRAIEVNQFLSRFKGCGSARQAASGIFNVDIGRTLEADATKLPGPLKKALDGRGVGRAIGPVRGPNGLQAIALCGIRKITPPAIKRPTNIQYPTADQVQNKLEQEQAANVQKQFSGKWRKGLLIEYRDPTYGQ